MQRIVRLLLASATLVASHVLPPRSLQELDQAATAEAQQRDDTATRAFSNVRIRTGDGSCIFVDKLSGDSRANLTPIMAGATCNGTDDGQEWDIITRGKHIDVVDSMLVVSTLTQACFNFDPRRPAGNQVVLFSCGGRADGSGQVTSSQIFAFDGSTSPLAFRPENDPSSCFVIRGGTVDIAACDANDPNQFFTISEAEAGDG